MRIVVAGWVGGGNLGDELVFAGLRHRLEAIGAQVTALSADPERTRRTHGVEAIGTGPKAVWDALGHADAMVFGGGGLLQDLTSAFNLPYHLARPAAAALRRLPVAGVGLGAEGLTRPASGWMVRQALHRFVAVTVRDEESASTLRALGVPQPLVSADLALSLPLPQDRPGDEVVVALRPFLPGRAFLPVQARRRRPPAPGWFLDAIAGQLDRLAGQTGLGVRFVAFERRSDDAVHRLVAERMRTPAVFAVPGLDQVIGQVATGRVVVAMRYHAAIAATLAGRPVVSLGYAPKVAALARTLGGGASLLTLDPSSIAALEASATAVMGRDQDVLAARERLRDRERRNDEAIAALVTQAR